MKNKQIYLLECGGFYENAGYVVGAFSTKKKLLEYVKNKYPDAVRDSHSPCFFEDVKRRVWYRGENLANLDPVAEKRYKLNERKQTNLGDSGQ